MFNNSIAMLCDPICNIVCCSTIYRIAMMQVYIIFFKKYILKWYIKKMSSNIFATHDCFSDYISFRHVQWFNLFFKWSSCFFFFDISCALNNPVQWFNNNRSFFKFLFYTMINEISEKSAFLIFYLWF